MKTVMKKMFCLLLVAVLMVGIMPFQAFAAEETKAWALTLTAGETYSVDAIKAENYEGASTNYWVHLKNTEDYLAGETFEAIEGGDYTLYVVETVEETQPVVKTCGTCGESYTEGAEHTCPTVTCETCKETYTKGAAHTCPTVTCETCKETYTKGTAHTCPTVECEVCHSVHIKGAAHNYYEEDLDQVRVYLNLNYGSAYAYGEDMEYILVDWNTPLYEVVEYVDEPSRDDHTFQYWTTDISGKNIIDFKNDARATADGVMIYAQWVDVIQSTDGEITLTVDQRFDNLVDSITDIASGTVMGNILDYIGTPVRLNYKFVGWYWDKNCTHAVEYSDKIYKDRTIYAKWEKRTSYNNILLKIYLNGDTMSLIRTVDMYDYSLDDGCISLAEVKEVVKKYYSAKNSEGMLFEGLFNTDTWSEYTANHKVYDGEPYIKVSKTVNEDTTVYVMVHNAKVRSYSSTSGSSSSSAKADSTNPKTGDAIFAPAMVLGLSASALVVLYYLNKKRAF